MPNSISIDWTKSCSPTDIPPEVNKMSEPLDFNILMAQFSFESLFYVIYTLENVPCPNILFFVIFFCDPHIKLRMKKLVKSYFRYNGSRS